MAMLAWVQWADATAAQDLDTHPVTLAEAIEIARDHGPGVAAALARSEAAAQERRRAKAGRLPSLGLEAGVMRTNDPVAAFGSRLRQGRFTQADFDPAGLNHPDPLTDWSAALGLGWSLLDLSRESDIRAADHGVRAADLGARWAERVAAFVVEARYLEAVGAEHAVTAAHAAVAAAEANLALISRRVEEGVLTDAERLRAQAAATAASARLIDAERLLADARGRLGVALGWPAQRVPLPVDDVLSNPATATGAAEDGIAQRPDLQASALQTHAARARLDGVSRARLPRIVGFARLETHARDALGGAERGWTAGVQLSLPVFTGFALDASRRASSATLVAAEAEHADRLRQAETAAAEARRAANAAERGSRAAVAASDAATEAARLTRRRFEEGLATTADLLAADASAADLSSRATEARLGHRLALAHLAFLTDTTTHTSDLSGGFNR